MFNLPSFGVGFLAGFGTGFVTREIVATSRPVAKSLIKTGLAMVERGRETVAYTVEAVEDLVAEAKSEIREEQTQDGQVKSTVAEQDETPTEPAIH